MSSNFFMISSGAMDRAEEAMRELVKGAGVRNSLLLDHGGYVFLHQGAFPFLPPQEMGAVISGAYASLNTLVSMTAASDLTVKFHDTPIGSLLLSQVTRRIILAVAFDEVPASSAGKAGTPPGVTAEDAARAAARAFIKRVRPLIEADETVESGEEKHLPFSSVQYIEERLSDLFDEI